FQDDFGHEDEENREGLESADSGKNIQEENEDDAAEENEYQMIGRREMRQRAHSGNFLAKPHLLGPLRAMSTDSTVQDVDNNHHIQRRLARQLSLEEMEDLSNY
uniref:Uncharacterized protein n=1 Tax=Globisporangium ultimum (strain ATCC 200006 / CBS 805.95 / DAOM BR144) TaxID=431595 RepID=K3WEV3_GLOUD